MQKSEYIKFVCFFDERFILMEKEKGGVKSKFESPHLYKNFVVLGDITCIFSM